MDYKNTLNLPQTDFPMKADLLTREPARLKQWEAAGLYPAIQAQRAGAEKFVLHDGPPFANGDVHIAISEGRPVMQDKLLGAGAFGLDGGVQPGGFPLLQPRRLPRDQVRLHGEVGLRQIQCVLVVHAAS